MDYERQENLLIVRFPEYETADQVRPHLDSALRLSEELGHTSVLVDTTASHIALSALDYQRVGQYIERRSGGRSLRIAVVRRPGLLPEARQLEQFSARGTVRYRVFSDREEAVEWLRGGGSTAS